MKLKFVIIFLLFISFRDVLFAQSALNEFVVEPDNSNQSQMIFYNRCKDEEKNLIGVVVFFTAIPNVKFSMPDSPRRLISTSYENGRYVLCMKPTDKKDAIGGIFQYSIEISADGFKTLPSFTVKDIVAGVPKNFRINPKESEQAKLGRERREAAEHQAEQERLLREAAEKKAIEEQRQREIAEKHAEDIAKALREYNIRIESSKQPVLSNVKADIDDKKNGIDMIFVEGGTFSMGCTGEQGNCDSFEKPVHKVTLNSFYIGKYEVTQKQWQMFMGTSIKQKGKGKKLAGKGDSYPMYYVTWKNAVEFCNNLSEQAGIDKYYNIKGNNITINPLANGYRLPTEAEWEYAARGGNKSNGYRYSGHNVVDSVAWYKENIRNEANKVGTKQANELGIYDMSGNVWEWCYDWYGSYGNASQINPVGNVSGDSRIIRGGSWNWDLDLVKLKISARASEIPNTYGNDIGFRLARNGE